jgi:hypothetical protein
LGHETEQVDSQPRGKITEVTIKPVAQDQASAITTALHEGIDEVITPRQAFQTQTLESFSKTG